MLNKKDRNEILAGFEKNMAKSEMEHFDGGHEHTPENPFGLHTHNKGEAISGPHTHTPQNPGGEHAHGELEGQTLIDGAHTHDEMGRAWHWHKGDKPQTTIPISKPGIKLPESPGQPKPE